MLILLTIGIFMVMLGFLAIFDEQKWALPCQWIGVAIIWTNVFVIMYL